jgi:hypothetical protein
MGATDGFEIDVAPSMVLIVYGLILFVSSLFSLG